MKDLSKYVSWNLAGSFVPTVAAVPALGYLAKALSTELMGALTIVWALVGYLSILDLGVGRAITRHVAASPGDSARIGRGIGTGLCIVLVSGIAAGAILATAAPWIASTALEISRGARGDVTVAIRLIGLLVPAVVVTAALQGHVEGLEQFDVLNIQRASGGTAIALAPVAGILLFGPSLESAVLGLCVARVAALLLAVFFSVRACRVAHWRINRMAAGELIGFGGWLTVTNVVSGAMNYIDRFWLAHSRGSPALAFYAVPAELVLRMSMLPVAISRSVFPRLVGGGAKAQNFARRGRIAIIISCGSVFLVVLVAASALLRRWVGEAYAIRATEPLRILALGFFSSSVAQIPYTRLQAQGLAWLTARLHMVEFAAYVVLICILIPKYGPVGAAIAWTTRVTADWIALEITARWKLQNASATLSRSSDKGQSKVLQPRDSWLA